MSQTKRQKEARQASRDRLASWLVSINDNPELVQKDIDSLIRLQNKLHKLYLQACNGPELTWLDKEHQRRLEVRIQALIAGFGLAVTFNDDPRGHPVYIHEEGKTEEDRQPCNDMGGRGWAIW